MVNIPNVGDLGGGVGDAVSNVAEKVTKGAITDVVDGAVNKLENAAEAVGLGAVAEKVVNAVESKIGIDIDGDKDVAK
jgi:hypothetical protein